MCKSCGTVVSSITMVDKLCINCQPKDIREEKEAETAKHKELKENRQVALSSVTVTTETIVDFEIIQRVEVISVSRIYGINIIKDFFSGIRDIVGGRVQSLEGSLQDASREIIEEMQEKAFLKDANAIVSLKIEHTYNNANGGSILSVFGTGTIVHANFKSSIK